MKITKVSATFGVSVNPNPGTWLKWSAGIDIDLEDNDNVNEAWDVAWNNAVSQVNLQAERSRQG